MQNERLLISTIAHGNELMKSDIKESYRQAFAEFLRAKDYVGDYEGIDNKIQDAKLKGMSRVFDNNSKYFTIKISTSSLNRIFWRSICHD